MVKQIAALEISNRYYKLVVGYVLENKVDILYKTKRPLSVPFKDGDIFDIGSLSDDLSKLNIVESVENDHKLKINVNEITLVLPPYGLQVYNSIKSTNTVSNISKIDKIDISNALALVKKEKLPNLNDELIDIIPNKFITDNNITYTKPPLNESSQTVTIDADVFTLPKKMVSDMKNACNRANFKVKREVIAPVGVEILLKNSNFKYPTYILVDFSYKTTSLSLIGQGRIYSSNFFSLGIDDMIEMIVDQLNIDKEVAEKLVNTYGIDIRKTAYNPYIVESKDGRKFTKDDLMDVIYNFFKTWIGYFNGSLSNILNGNDEFKKTIPIVMMGNGADLNGLKDYMLKVFPTNPYEKIVLPVVACRESEFINCISAIYMSSSYRGALEDENKLQVASVKREETYKKQDKYDELKDEL